VLYESGDVVDWRADGHGVRLEHRRAPSELAQAVIFAELAVSGWCRSAPPEEMVCDVPVERVWLRAWGSEERRSTRPEEMEKARLALANQTPAPNPLWVWHHQAWATLRRAPRVDPGVEASPEFCARLISWARAVDRDALAMRALHGRASRRRLMPVC